MKRTLLGFGVLCLVGCGGPSEEVDHAKTPDEIIAEQERLGAEQERKSKEHAQFSGSLDAEETDMEKKQQFDKKQTKLELQRATRSAETCVGVTTDKDSPRGTGKVTLVFDNEGHVKSGSIAPPFEGTAIGKCVMNAYNAVIVPPYVGPETSVDWEVDLTGTKKDDGKKASKDE